MKNTSAAAAIGNSVRSCWTVKSTTTTTVNNTPGDVSRLVVVLVPTVRYKSYCVLKASRSCCAFLRKRGAAARFSVRNDIKEARNLMLSSFPCCLPCYRDVYVSCANSGSVVSVWSNDKLSRFTRLLGEGGGFILAPVDCIRSYFYYLYQYSLITCCIYTYFICYTELCVVKKK